MKLQRFGFLISLLFLFSLAYSQQKETPEGKFTLTGKVLDSLTNTPLEYATITLFLSGKNKVVNGGTTDQSGTFSITGLFAGDYNAVIEFIGYGAAKRSVHFSHNHEVVDLKNILLTKKQETLQSVTVTAPQKLIENKIDKLVFNAEKDITSQTGVATDILKKVPQVSVDIDGNVELAGSSSIRFLINGKPSTMFGSSINDVLQSIPASQIKSIEVITNPGAKYDAQGLGGIINIILKKNTAQGINGNVSLTAGSLNQNGSFNFNARKGKFGVNAFINGNARLTRTTPYASQRISTDTSSNAHALLQQDGNNEFNRHGMQSGVGFDWTLKERNNFSGSFTYGDFGFKNHGAGTQTELIQDGLGNLISQLNTSNKTQNQFNEQSFDFNLNYKRTFEKEDQELEVSFNSSLGPNNRKAGNDQYLEPNDSLIYGTRSNNPGKENESQLVIDYVHPFTENVHLGIGGKVNFYDIKSTSDILVWQNSLMGYVYDSTLSNNLDYHQKIYAFYTELSFPIGKLLDAKLGGRYERTQINSFYSNANAEINNGYNTFVPSIFLMRKIGDNQTLKLNYSKRIQRPDFDDLNPYINTNDPKNITTGNPYLKPEFSNRIELSYNNDLGRTGSFGITLFYRGNQDDIQPFVTYYPSIVVGDTTYTNVAVTTRENIGTERNFGSNLSCDLHVNNKFNVRTNFFFFYRHTINEVDKGYNSYSTNYRFNLNASYQFPSNFAAEFFGNFNSPRHEAQGKYPSFTSYSFAARKLIWKKKGSIAITMNNVFSEYIRQEMSIFGPGFITNTVRKVPSRSIGINFTWKFGKLEFKKEKDENNENSGGQGDL